MGYFNLITFKRWFIVINKKMVQNRINELSSGIIEYKDNSIFITGFYNADCLNSHLNKGVNNFSSKGMYPVQEFNFNTIQTNALFIVKKKDASIEKHQYRLIYKGSHSSLNKIHKTVLTIRKSVFSSHYSILTDANSQICKDYEELVKFLSLNYKQPQQILDNIPKGD